MIYVILGLAAIAIFLFWVSQRQAKKIGKAEAENETQGEVIKNVKDDVAIRDRFKSDPSYRDSVQRRFDK